MTTKTLELIEHARSILVILSEDDTPRASAVKLVLRNYVLWLQAQK